MNITYIINRTEHKRWLFGDTHIFDSHMDTKSGYLKLTVFDKVGENNIGQVCRTVRIDTRMENWRQQASSWQLSAKRAYEVKYA